MFFKYVQVLPLLLVEINYLVMDSLSHVGVFRACVPHAVLKMIYYETARAVNLASCTKEVTYMCASIQG